MNWYLEALRRYAEFSGRSRRREYWIFVLVNFVIGLALSWTDVALGLYSVEAGIGLLGAVYALAVLVPGLTVSVRRLHDSDRSGWWLLLIFIPVLGWLVLIVFMLLDGNIGDNRFGPDPKQRRLSAAGV